MGSSEFGPQVSEDYDDTLFMNRYVMAAGPEDIAGLGIDAMTEEAERQQAGVGPQYTGHTIADELETFLRDMPEDPDEWGRPL